MLRQNKINKANDDSIAKQQATAKHRKPNYWKYESVKPRLREELENGNSTKEIAECLKISIPTFHKYKGLLSAEDNRIYKTREENGFLNSKKSNY